MKKFKKSLSVLLVFSLLISGLTLTAATPASAETKAARLYADAKVASGWYVLRPGCTSTRALTINGQSTSNGATAILYAWLKSPQYFYIKGMGDGTYTIRNYKSGKYLEVKGSSTSSGATVQQWTENGRLQQRWYISKSGTRYVIQSSLSKNVLSVLNAQNANGAKVFTHSRSTSPAQLWELIKVGGSSATPTPKPTATPTPKPKATATPTPKPSSGETKAARLYADAKVASGWYVFRPGCTTTRAMTISGQSKSNGAQGVLYTWLKSPQYFYIKNMGDGTYTIRNYTSDKYMEVKGSSKTSGAIVQQWTENGKLQQRWYIGKVGDRYVIQNTLSKNVLSVTGSKNANNAGIIVLTRSDSNASQKWELLKVTASKATPTPTPKATATPTPKPQATPTPTPKGATGQSVANRKLYSTTINGKKTLKTYLQNSMVPCGRTLYIWGGGWGGIGTDTAVIGYQQTWADWFDASADASYDYTKYRYNYKKGLDCSGFAGWLLYNACYTSPGQANLVQHSTEVASYYAGKGWAVLAEGSSDQTFKPGDVVSMDGHVWISLGQYSDKSVLMVHSSPKGVQISGTAGTAAAKAKYYMSKYFPEWPYDARTVGSSYLKYVGKARWITSGTGALLKDPEGVQNMSADQVMKMLLGS